MTKPVGRYHIEHNRAAPSPTGGWVLASDYDAALAVAEGRIKEQCSHREEAETKVDALEAALRKYGGHTDDCQSPVNNCTCGLTALLEKS